MGEMKSLIEALCSSVALGDPLPIHIYVGCLLVDNRVHTEENNQSRVKREKKNTVTDHRYISFTTLVAGQLTR